MHTHEFKNTKNALVSSSNDKLSRYGKNCCIQSSLAENLSIISSLNSFRGNRGKEFATHAH